MVCQRSDAIGFTQDANETSTPRKNSRFLSVEQEQIVLSRWGKNCWYCGKTLLSRDDVRAIEPTPVRVEGQVRLMRRIPDDCDRLIFDHVIARSNGGADHPDNCVPTCNICNATKRNMTVAEFRRYRSRQLQDSSFVFWAEQWRAKS